MAAEPTIDYETLTQDAMRGVVRTVLTQAAKTGLPGDHHFYISFDTNASGVVLSKRLRDKYPAEMTIVLQHRFWDLLVSDTGFEVKLTFDGIPERLVVPYTAIRVFFDPSVRYGMQFEGSDAEPELDQEDGGFNPRIAGGAADRPNGGRTATLRSTAPKKPRVPRKPAAASSKPEGPGAVEPDAPFERPAPAESSTPQPELKGAPMFESVSIKDDENKTGDAADSAAQGNGGGAQIVSLDAFRKK